jgi:hypothetical protein
MPHGLQDSDVAYSGTFQNLQNIMMDGETWVEKPGPLERPPKAAGGHTAQRLTQLLGREGPGGH